MGMEGGSQLVEVEGNPMGLVGGSRGLDLAWPLDDQANERQLAGVRQTIQRSAVQPIDRHAGGGGLPQHRASPRMPILDIPHHVIA